MPPTDRFVICFAAEPPQEPLPYGRWADTLRGHFLAALEDIDTEGEELGEPGEIAWFPDRTYAGRTYIPAVARTAEGMSCSASSPSARATAAPGDFEARADFTTETAEANPDWKLDLNDEVVAVVAGRVGNAADMTLVWGVPLIPGGVMVTAELANLAVDQCELIDERFTLLAPDNYRSDYLEVKLWDKRGEQLAVESLYVEEDEEEDDEDEDEAGAEA